MHNHAHHTHLLVPLNTEMPRLMRLATSASICVAISLVILKLGAWYLTDSLSLFSSLVDSLLDVLTSGINFLAIRYALMPPDDDHKFGHGKAEDIAGLAQSMFIAGTGLFILFEGVRRLFAPVELVNNTIGIWVMGISLAATILLVLFQQFVVRRTGSRVVAADSLHYLTDILSNGGVIFALYASRQFGWTLADPIIAFMVAGYIFWGAWGIGIASFHNLMDRELDEQDREKIKQVARDHSGILGVHALRTRRSGMNVFIQMHVDIDENLPLKQAHAIAEALEAKILAAFPHSEVLIHEDPVKS